jgi:large subunit ribosomal protein L27Ae
MRHFNAGGDKNARFIPCINIDKLWTLVPGAEREKFASQSEQAPVLDVTRAGYFKVLGRGHLPKQPIIVKAKYFSKTAEKRIKAAGGACVLTA